MFFTKGVGLIYVDRGDLDDYDFSTGDLIKDANWHDLDLSSKIPIGTKLVVMLVELRASTGNKLLYLRQKGNSYDVNNSILVNQVTNTPMCGDMFVVPDVNRVIEYWISTATWTFIHLTVRGYFLGH